MNWFIWGSYGVTFVLLFIEVVLLIKRTRETKA
jgi:heme exporter protein CcmD